MELSNWQLRTSCIIQAIVIEAHLKVLIIDQLFMKFVFQRLGCAAILMDEADERGRGELLHLASVDLRPKVRDLLQRARVWHKLQLVTEHTDKFLFHILSGSACVLLEEVRNIGAVFMQLFDDSAANGSRVACWLGCGSLTPLGVSHIVNQLLVVDLSGAARDDVL